MDLGLQGVDSWHGNAPTLPDSQQGNDLLHFPSLEAPPMVDHVGLRGMPSFSQQTNIQRPQPFERGAFRLVQRGLARGGPLPPPKRRRAACPGCNRQSIAIGSCSLLCSNCLSLLQPPDSAEPPPGALCVC
eukprot:6175048-Pleurochrysis_carterae.AAC.2